MKAKPNTTAAVLLLSLAAVQLSAAGPEADAWNAAYNVKPAVLRSTPGDRLALAARYEAKAKYDYAPWRGPTAFVKGVSEGTVATLSEANSDDLFAELQLGAAFQLMKGPRVPPPPESRDPTAPPATPPATGGYRLGRLELGAKVRLETDQPFENYSLTYGPQLAYFHNNTRGAWPLVPSLCVDYQRVEPLHSRFLRSLGEDEDGFYRLSTVASWDLPLGEALAPRSRYLGPLGAIFNLRDYRAQEVPSAVRQSRRDESRYYEGGLNYEFTDLRCRWLRSAYVTVAHGRKPPVVDNKTMVFVGVVLGWDAMAARR